MKKIAAVLVITLATNASSAFYGSQLIQKEHHQEHTKLEFLDAPTSRSRYERYDEYTNNPNDDGQTEEYDQYVCDDASSPKISAAEALIKEMLGFVLIQYLAVKEMAHFYCQEIKDALQQWFCVLKA